MDVQEVAEAIIRLIQTPAGEMLVARISEQATEEVVLDDEKQAAD